MAHVMVSFLGKGGAQLGGGYRTARYAFPSGAVRETPYFGLGLLEECALTGQAVDRAIFLGTRGSIWGALLGAQMTDDDLWVKLSEQAEAETVTQTLLDQVCGHVADGFQGRGLARTVCLELIPYGADLAEQVEILRVLSKHLARGDAVTLDLSHGFRHLPMLGLVSALLLKSLKQAQIMGLYYGALEMTPPGGATPVLRLDGLLRVAEWLSALQVFQASGDYGVFGPLLEAEGVSAEHSENLAQSAFAEKILRVDRARKALSVARTAIAGAAGSSAVLGLFAEELLARSAWVTKERHFERQLAVARTALEYGDYTRAAALALESVITARMPVGKDPLNHREREKVRQALNQLCTGIGGRNVDPAATTYFQLNTLRNSLAHGTRPKGNLFELQQLMDDEAALRRRLVALLDDIEKGALEVGRMKEEG